MFKNIRQLLGDSIIYGLSGVITRFISVFLIPVYTRIFNPADYGIINLVNTTFLLIGIFVVLGVDNSAGIWYWDKESDDERKKTFSSWFWMQLVLSVVILIIVAAGAGFFSGLILGDPGYKNLFLLAALNLPLTTFTLVFSAWLRITRQPRGAVTFSLLNSLITIGLSILLVVYLKSGVKGVFLAQLFSNIVSACVVIWFMSKNISIRFFNMERMKEMVRYSLPLVPSVMAFWLMSYAGVYVINHYATKTDVGLYQIGSSIAAVCNIIFWAFLQAWSPFAMSIHKQDDAPKIFSVVFDLYCAAGSTLVLFIFLFSPEILLVFTTASYFNAAVVAGILSINIFIANITQITSIGSAIRKTNIPYLVGVFSGSAVTVILFFVLIPIAGKEGAAIATLAGSAVLSAIVTYRSQLLFFIPYHVPKNILIIGSMVAAGIISYFIRNEVSLMGIVYKIILMLLFMALVIFMNKNSVARLLQRLPSRTNIN